MTYDDFFTQWRDSSTHIECHTSGSTGKPSTIFLPKEQMRNSALRTISFFNLDATSHLHSCIAPDFIGGKMMGVRADVLKCAFTYETPSNQPLCNCQSDSLSLVAVVPSQMIYILDNLHTLPNVDNFLIGGSAIPDTLRRRIIDAGINAFESYGMTETSSHIALRKITELSSYFQTLPGISVSLSDNHTLEIEIEGWQKITTNDIARLHESNQFEILGRADNVIISGGKKIHPEEIERKLSAKFDFRFFVTSRPDHKWGQRLILVAEAPESFTEQIRLDCIELLDKHEIPKEIICKDRLELTNNGKIKRFLYY